MSSPVHAGTHTLTGDGGVSRADAANPVEKKSFQGIVVPEEGSKEKPKLKDSAFTGKACRTRDKAVRSPEKDDTVESLYWLHPNLKVDVEPSGAAGVSVKVKSGPFNIAFSPDKPTSTNVWRGKAQVDAVLEKFPSREKEKKNYEVPFFSFETSRGRDGQVHTLTYMKEAPQKTKEFTGTDVIDVTASHYEKVSSDGEYISFAIYKNDKDEIVGYFVHAICGERFTAGKEIDVQQGYQPATPSKIKPLLSLLEPSNSLSVPKPPEAPNLAGLSEDDQRKALDRYLEDLERYKAQIAKARDGLVKKPTPEDVRKQIAREWKDAGGDLDTNGYPYIYPYPHRKSAHARPLVAGQLYNVGGYYWRYAGKNKFQAP